MKENIKILKQDHFGRGIAKIDGKTYFVEYALPEEVVDIEIIKDKSKYTVAKVKDFINKTECPYYLECGGCHILHQKYKEQLKFKENKVKEIVTKYLDNDGAAVVLHQNSLKDKANPYPFLGINPYFKILLRYFLSVK